MAELDDRSGRDSRLLALVILIALAVLVVLARFKFPGADSRPAAVSPGPLERLAARATYDDLAGAVHTALQRVEPALMVVILEHDADAGKALPASGGEIIPSSSPERRRVVGIRLRGDWVIAYAPRAFRVAAATLGDQFAVKGADPAKDVTVIAPVAGEGGNQSPSVVDEFAGFAYVCVVEPTGDGPTSTPMFIGRVRSVPDERWGGNVLVPGGSATIPLGALVFQLDGRFVGMSTAGPDGSRALVPAGLLELALSAVGGRAPGDSR